LDSTKYSPVFEEYVNESGCDLNKVFEMTHSEIENLVTLTSSRGVGKTVISLRNKSSRMWRFDEFNRSIKNKLESLNKECKLAISFKENIPELAFELYSLDNWTIREKTAQ
jgi:hypothetical protein